MALQLERFVEAQQDVYQQALAELRDGRKRSHWMWFVFPQIAGLGRSETARYYAIADIAEARAYLAHPLLGPRLGEAVDAVLAHAGRISAEALFGGIDAIKLRSSMTLFEAAAPNERRFAAVLDRLYGGARDSETLQRLAPS
ncbi:DUF1810 domain-containing protein [Sphingomonas psychrotolerans]|uniref:DUF1810 domain-containing protein n=1 Tax=Sphingomonas psychrotolerans TaxID=1327635 RepID=A0ABU3N6S5_9SPHN|nr:DUF1810 domain-containing protein [Sphingomonas psychrotolerans]MDT8759996.1 DUF1810 domain-containing protein [Sphingomonas psychrotolerans]